MTSFDPETGERIRSVTAVRPSAPVNPWDRALTVLWIGGAALAALCGFLALLRPVDGITADGAPTVPGAGVLAAWSAAVALGAGIAQIAVHAARWRPPS